LTKTKSRKVASPTAIKDDDQYSDDGFDEQAANEYKDEEPKKSRRPGNETDGARNKRKLALAG